MNINIFNNIYESQNNYSERRKADTKEYVIYDSLYIKW